MRARGRCAPAERRRADQPANRHQAQLPRAVLAPRAAAATSTLPVGERLLERGPDVGQREAEGRLQPGG